MPDNELMVTEGSSVKLTYSNGCVLEVNGDIRHTVQEESPCQAGALLATVGGAAAATSSATPALIALAAFAGTALVINELDDDDDGQDGGGGGGDAGETDPDQPPTTNPRPRPPISP